MGSNSLESNGSFAHAATDLDASPDLDDALVQQGLSMYQAARDAGRDFGFQLKERDIPIRVHNGKIEFEIDLPRDIRQTNCFPSEESRRSEKVDRAIIRDFDPESDYAPSKPYLCSARHRPEPRPIDERIVACSSRIRIEEVPVFGCSQRIKVEIDPPGFYLCSAHIRLKPDWAKDEGPSETHLCADRWRPSDKDDWYACMAKIPIDGLHPHPKNDYMLCVARQPLLPIDGVKMPKDDFMLCVAKIKHPLAPGDGFEPPKEDYMLCVAKVKQPLRGDLDQIMACSAKFIPYVPREKADNFVELLEERKKGQSI